MRCNNGCWWQVSTFKVTTEDVFKRWSKTTADLKEEIQTLQIQREEVIALLGRAWRGLHGLGCMARACNLGCHTWAAIPGLPYLGCHTWAAIPGLPYLGCHTWAAIPGLPYLGCHTWAAILGLPYLDCHTWAAIPGLPYLSCHTWVAIPGLPYLGIQLVIAMLTSDGLENTLRCFILTGH